jgi:hypothetical protein
VLQHLLKGGIRVFKHRGELPIPPAAQADRGAAEITRVWTARGEQHVSVRTGLWEDPAAWGLMLVDLARHVANAYQQQEGRSREEVLRRIREGLDAEWNSPTGRAEGELTE